MVLIHGLLITPILIIGSNFNINFNHLTAEVYIFCILFPACVYIARDCDITDIDPPVHCVGSRNRGAALIGVEENGTN